MHPAIGVPGHEAVITRLELRSARGRREDRNEAERGREDGHPGPLGGRLAHAERYQALQHVVEGERPRGERDDLEGARRPGQRDGSASHQDAAPFRLEVPVRGFLHVTGGGESLRISPSTSAAGITVASTRD